MRLRRQMLLKPGHAGAVSRCCAKIRRSTKRIGVSVSLTYMLALLEQCLERIEILLNMVLDDDDLRYQSIGLFIADITEAII